MKEFFENESKERRASRLRPKSSSPPAPENQVKISPNPSSDFVHETDSPCKEMDLSPRTNKIYAFLSKAYDIVDDPSTDNIISWGPNGTTFIVWKPLKCQRDLLTQHLGVTSFARFLGYCRALARLYLDSGQQLESEHPDFVKGNPELLEKIGDRYVAKLRASYAKRYKPLEDQLKNAKEEWDLAVKEQNEFFENDSKERRAIRLRMENPPLTAEQVPENQVQHNGT
ncbi:unnamed protein product [Eruca vesicaria subsp. sativa]|uniref:HSF-type DNA-binding domain-containing protein n=1 Tax=Eruca vesicaria subsp. sativa TaxID=29727 RepID=A0ABC8JML6_ERUVS|nr:unnamed protein product [Eruca vesicaria subsp. sativa]